MIMHEDVTPSEARFPLSTTAAKTAGELAVAAVSATGSEEERAEAIHTMNEAVAKANLEVVDTSHHDREARYAELLILMDVANKHFGGNRELARRALARAKADRQAKQAARDALGNQASDSSTPA
jgi:hypothetical protein